MRVKDLIVCPQSQQSHTPAHHQGAIHLHLVCRQTVGASLLEVHLGVVEPGAEGNFHSHPASEQALYVLDGKAAVEVDGDTAEIGPGEIIFFPCGVPHKVTPLGQVALKALAIYAPPLDER